MRFIIFFLLISSSAMVWAIEPQTSIGVAGIVNDQVISTIDLDERVALVMATTGIPDTPENRMRITPQILRMLIDEVLQMQEAERNAIVVNDVKLHEAIAQIEVQSNKPSGSFEKFLESKHLSKISFYAQVRAQIAWSEIVLKKIRPRIRISDQEVARYVKHTEETPGSATEVQIATILLPVDSPSRESGVQKVADKLATEIRSGASFEATASHFSSGSQSSGAFWVELSQLDPLISSALNKTSKGNITNPIRTANGYQIIKLLDTRQIKSNPSNIDQDIPRTEIAYKKLVMHVIGDGIMKDESVHSALSEIAKVSACESKEINLSPNLNLNIRSSLERKISTDLTNDESTLLMSAKLGALTEALKSDKEVTFYSVCERTELPPMPHPKNTDAIRQSIYTQKLELEAQKFLRTLRRDAFVDIRLKQ